MPRWRGAARRRQLTVQQEGLLCTGELLDHWENHFTDMEDARAAWFDHRERLIAEYGRPCLRLWAWWKWEAPPWRHLVDKSDEMETAGLRLRPGSENSYPTVPLNDQAEVLEQLGLLSDLEKAQLAQWRALWPPGPEAGRLDDDEWLGVDSGSSETP